MKAIYKHIAFAALALSAVACSQDDDFASSYLSDPDAVRITAQVGTADVTGGFTRSNPLGTAEEQAKFNSGDQISVTAGTQAPVTYQLSTDGWKPVGEAYLKWQTNEMNVTAYYPVGKNNASATTFTVPTEYTDLAAIAEADYMTYSGTQTKGDDMSINLEMRRKMVRLVIDEISFNDQFPEEDYAVTAITVHGNTNGYANGELVAGDVAVTAYKHTDDAFYALLAPTTADAEATFLTVTVSDGTTSQELTVKGIPATTAGNSYSFALTVGKDKVAMGAANVNDWTGATIEGGEAGEIFPTPIDATSMSADDLNAAVAEQLAIGFKSVEVTLPETPDAAMFTAIRRAICDTENVSDGSIHLTLKGVTSIPDGTGSGNGENFCLRDAVKNEDYTEIILPREEVTQLATINLPDATYIGDYAFNVCRNLTAVTAPKVTAIGSQALSHTALKAVAFPELTTIGRAAFYGCNSLTEVDFPKLATIGGSIAFRACFSLTAINFPNLEILPNQAFYSCTALSEVYLPKATSIGESAFDGNTALTKLVLTAEGDIIMNYDSNSSNANFDHPFRNVSTKNINLVLNSDKMNQVQGNTWTTKDANGNNVSNTFKSIAFACSDGTTNHTFESVTNNNDGTHTFTCTTCNLTITESCRGGEVTCQEHAICEICGEEYGELSDHIMDDPSTGYCKFGCGEIAAAAKVTLGETTTYYETINAVRSDEQDGSTVTLLKNITTGYLQWGGCDFTLDLNGFNFDRGGYELYVSNGGGEEVSLVNTSATRAGINAVLVSDGGQFTIDKNVDIVKIRIGSTPAGVLIDIKDADFTSTTLEIGGDGFSTSQITSGSYAVYNASGDVVTGMLTNGVTYTIKAAQ